MLEIVYAENSEQVYEKTLNSFIEYKNRFCECSKQIRIYSKHDVQRAYFAYVEIDLTMQKKKFIHCEI